MSRKNIGILVVFLAASMLLSGCKVTDILKTKLTEKILESGDTTEVSEQEAEADQTDAVQDQPKETEDGTEDDTEDAIAATAEAKEAFDAFLRGDSVLTADVEAEYFRIGNRYSIKELIETYLIEEEWKYGTDAALYDAKVAEIDCGADGKKELVLWLEYGNNGLGGYNNIVYFLRYLDDGVHLFGSDTWAYRSEISVNQNGYCSESGSYGATSWYREYYFFNADCERIFLYSETSQFYNAEPMIDKYYLQNGAERTDYSENEYDEHGYTVQTVSFIEYVYDPAETAESNYEKYYRNYMYSFEDENGNSVSPPEKWIAFYQRENVDWYPVEELKQKIDAHETALGVTKDIKTAASVYDWTSIADNGTLNYKVVRESAEND